MVIYNIFKNTFLFLNIFFLLFTKVTFSCDEDVNIYQNKTFIGNTRNNKFAIEYTLRVLKLSSTLKNNDDLLKAIESVYGKEVVMLLIEKHPFLEHKEGLFDLKTLVWFVEEYFKLATKDTDIYFLAPFFEKNSNHGFKIIMKTILNKSMPDFSTKPIFISNNQLDEVKNKFSKDNFKYPIKYLTENKMIPGDIAEMLVNHMFEKLFIEQNYLILEDEKINSLKKLIIVGHGKPAEYTISSSGEEIHYDHIIDLIKNSHFPPTMDIDLNVCHSAVSNTNANTGKTEEELIDIFIKKDIDLLIGDKELSFSYQFSKSMYDEWAEFSGSIFSYKGSVSMGVNENIYIRDKENTVKKALALSVGLKDINNKKIYFDINEMRMIYNKENFN